MQTFLPYKDFVQSTKCLDMKRLGKQRVEAKQILEILLGKESRWKNHPAVKMWKGYEIALCFYGCIICGEWRDRGYVDNLLPFFLEKSKGYVNFDYPPFVGNEDFHRSHQSNLVRKFPEYYRKYFPEVPDNLPYIWTI